MVGGNYTASFFLLIRTYGDSSFRLKLERLPVSLSSLSACIRSADFGGFTVRPGPKKKKKKKHISLSQSGDFWRFFEINLRYFVRGLGICKILLKRNHLDESNNRSKRIDQSKFPETFQQENRVGELRHS